MKFLADHDVYAATSRFVATLGHDIVTAYERGFARRSDDEILELTRNEDRILITRDRDFGNLVFVGRNQVGVITCAFFLHLRPLRTPSYSGSWRPIQRLNCCIL